jgi:hypothetical protein
MVDNNCHCTGMAVHCECSMDDGGVRAARGRLLGRNIIPIDARKMQHQRISSYEQIIIYFFVESYSRPKADARR